MGHLVNPISLRLGINRIWVFSWFANNKYQYSYLTIQQSNIQIFLKKFFDLKIFSKKGYIFSHVNILNFSKFVDVRIYVYKTISNWNLNFLRLKQVTKIITKFFFKRVFYIIFLKLKFFILYYFSLFYYLLNNFFSELEDLKILKKNKSFFIVLLYLLLKRDRLFYFFNIIHNFFFFKLRKKIREKLKENVYVKGKKINKLFNVLILKIFFWFLKFKFWKKISFFLKFFFRIFLKGTSILRICKINYLNVNINIIGTYIVKRLKQRFKVVELILPVIRNLKKNKNLLGFKFSFCGRFSRKEMATTEIFSYAAVPLNTIRLYIDYLLVGVILKDSYCGVKIWLNRKRDKFLDLFFHTTNLIWIFSI